MKFKKSLIMLLILLILNLLVGCETSYMQEVYNNDTKIAAEGDSFGIDKSECNIDSGIMKSSVKFSGTLMLWKFKSSENMELKVPYKFSVKGGKAKIVLISPDNTVTTLIEKPLKSDEKEPDVLTISIKEGVNRIRLVGANKPDIDFELNIDKGEFLSF